MAVIFPKSPEFRTKGENTVFAKFCKFLDDMWIVFYEPCINGLLPDFVLLHPYYGMIVLEVKDYHVNTIKEVSRDYWVIFSNGREVSVKNPYHQAINYRNELINLLSVHNEIIETRGKYRGKIKLPIVGACIFPELKRSDIKKLDIDKIILSRHIICKDELDDGVALNRLFTSMLEMVFKIDHLQKKEVSLIQQLLYPSYQIKKNDDHLIGEPKYTRGSYGKDFDIFYGRFNHYVDEIFFICDYIASKFILHEETNIIVSFPVNRYLNDCTIKEYIREIFLQKGLFSNEKISIYITETYDMNIENNTIDYLFLMDINSLDSIKVFWNLMDRIKKGLLPVKQVIITANKNTLIYKKIVEIIETKI